LLKRFQSFFDTCAVGISAICAVHCIALPVLLIAFPVLGGTVLTDELFHSVLLWFILPTSVIAVLLARQHHPDRQVLMLVGAGMLILIGAAFWAHDHAPPFVDTAMSLVGGGLLALGHIRNFLLCRH
jgi:cation transport ATPase